MKSKLAALILLGIISAANAELRLAVDAEVDIPAPPDFAFMALASDTCAVGIHNDDPDQPGLDVFLHVTGPGSLAFWDTVINVVNGPDGVTHVGPEWSNIIRVNLAKPEPAFRVPTGIVADNIMFHIEGVFWGTILLTDSPTPGSGTTLHTIYWTEVPEPATLTILTLGALFLSRRKRQIACLADDVKDRHPHPD